MTPYLCTNCGFWQRHFAVPPTCPVCTDFRHTPPEDGFYFLTPDAAAAETRTVWTGEDTDIVTFRAEPRVGIGPNGYLITDVTQTLLSATCLSVSGKLVSWTSRCSICMPIT